MTGGQTALDWRTVQDFAHRRLRHGRTFKRMLAQMEARERWNFDEMRAYQGRQLQCLLTICGRNVPHYVELFRRESFDLDKLSPWEVLARIPPLEKSEVRADPERFRNKAFPKKLLKKAETSGTTGTPLVCWRDVESINFENAMVWRQRRWAGLGYADRRVTLRGDLPVPTTQTSPPYWRYNAAERQLVMSSYHLSPATAADYAAALAAFAPTAVEGYPSSVALLARALRHAGVQSFPVNAIFTSSETLLDSQRKVGQDVFCAPFFDFYGNAERTAVICTCEEGRYHVIPDYSIVELLEGGEIVGTPLFNRAFPLLRYRSGDTALPAPDEEICPCGRAAFPIISEIRGRLDSYIVTPEGRMVGRLDHIFKGAKHIVESQIYQSTPGQIVVRVVRDIGYTSDDEAKLIQQARLRLGPTMQVSVEYVDNIPRTSRGKFAAVIGLQRGEAEWDASR